MTNTVDEAQLVDDEFCIVVSVTDKGTLPPLHLLATFWEFVSAF